MRGPPPVRLICRGDRRWRLFELTVGLVAAATAAGWLAWRLGVPSSTCWAVTALAGGAGAVWAWRHPTSPGSRLLGWTGTAWELDGSPVAPPVLRAAWGHWMLLSLPAGRWWRHVWLVLDGTSRPADARRLRAAVHAQPSIPGRVMGVETAHG